MHQFIIRAVKNKKEDPFGMTVNDEYVYFFCSSLKDLKATMRHINPPGYRIHSVNWFSKHIKLFNNHLTLYDGLFGHEKFRIVRIFEVPSDYTDFNYTNKSQQTYTLKIFNRTALPYLETKFKTV